jgi:hypothetical protein
VHLIPAREQELDEIRAILTTGSGYQSAVRHILYNVPFEIFKRHCEAGPAVAEAVTT